MRNNQNNKVNQQMKTYAFIIIFTNVLITNENKLRMIPMVKDENIKIK